MLLRRLGADVESSMMTYRTIMGLCLVLRGDFKLFADGPCLCAGGMSRCCAVWLLMWRVV